MLGTGKTVLRSRPIADLGSEHDIGCEFVQQGRGAALDRGRRARNSGERGIIDAHGVGGLLGCRESFGYGEGYCFADKSRAFQRQRVLATGRKRH